MCLKNAIEAISARITAGDTAPGRIVIDMTVNTGRLFFPFAITGSACPRSTAIA